MRIPLGTAVWVASGRSVTSAARSRTLSCASARLAQPNAPPDARNLQRLGLTDTRAAMSSYAQFNPARLRSYVLRLPLATRLLLTAIVGLWIATIPLPWLREFSQLEPAKMDLTQSMLPLFLHLGYIVEVPPNTHIMRAWGTRARAGPGPSGQHQTRREALNQLRENHRG
jgi:hypothetical protein